MSRSIFFIISKIDMNYKVAVSPLSNSNPFSIVNF